MLTKIVRLIPRKFRGSRKTSLWLCAVLILLTVLGALNGFFSSGDGSKQVQEANGLPPSSAESESVASDPKRDEKTESKCGIVCAANQKAFYVKTGIENTEGPIVCYDGVTVISDELQNGHRGINAVFISGDSKQVIETKTFDTYLDEYGFIRYMKQSIPEKTVVIMASFDEMTDKLKESRFYIKKLGSKKVDNLKFRDAWLLVGQLGLNEGNAIEFHLPKGKTEKYADVIEKKGCFSFPMGKLREIKDLTPQMFAGQEIKYGAKVENCGLESKCPDISVRVYTGDKEQRIPKICVNGQMVMDKDLNNAGRGFNIVIINEKIKKTTIVSRFDTYASDSLNLEFLLEGLSAGSIIIAVVSDDGSKKLNQHAKETLNKLGSSMIQNLKFRDVWYFIGQKNIKGFTTMEEISYASFDGDWPTPLEKSYCVPTKVIGTKTPPVPKVIRNEPRREFCKKYDGYADFCDIARIDEQLKPVELTDKSLKEDPIFKIPIVIIPGIDNNAIARTLETAFMLPGIHPDMVLVAYDESFPDYANLATLFGFKNVVLSSSTSYEGQVIKAMEQAWDIYKDANHLIVIEEELVLTTDFLSFMGQCLPVIDKDPTLFGISAWNYNGYDTTSGDSSMVYRVQEFPGLAFLIKKSVYNDYLKDFEQCCNKRVWDNWYLGSDVFAEILIPDTSRVFRQPYQSFNSDDEHLIELFHKPRLTNLEPNSKIENLDVLTRKEYDEYLLKQLENSSTLPIAELLKCWKMDNIQIKIPEDAKSNIVIYYEEKTDEEYDWYMLRKLCKCFGLFAAKAKPSRNLHEGLLRFYYKKKNMYFVESTSKFFSSKPESWDTLTHEKLRNAGKLF